MLVYLYLLLFFSLSLNVTLGYQITLQDTTTLVFKNYNQTFSVNGLKYRESSTYDPSNSQFTIKLPPGTWNVTNAPFYSTTLATINSRDTHLDRLLIKNKPRLIDTIMINVTSPNSLLWISSQMTGLPFPTSDKIKFPYYRLVVNGKIISQEQTPVFSRFINLPIDPGYYNISTIGYSKYQDWCSCPSVGNGFILSHDLWAWVSINNDKMAVTMTTNDNLLLNSEEGISTDLPSNLILDTNSIFNNIYLTSVFSALIFITK